MSIAGKNKLLFLILLALVSVLVGPNITRASSTQDPGTSKMNIDTTEAAAAVANMANSPNPLAIKELCQSYPGFINKIVLCVTHMTTRTRVIGSLNILYKKFAGAGTAVLILYIAMFGMKLSLNAVDNARGEIMIVILTCFFMTYVLNVSRIDKFIYFFVGLQNEFAHVATSAIFSKESADLTAAQSNGTTVAQNSRFICYGPLDKDGKLQPGDRYSIWQRADCLFAYMIGVHPLVQKMGQYFDAQGRGDGTVDPAHPLSNHNQAINYSMFAGKYNPFAQMAEDPFCFFSYATKLDFDVSNAAKFNEFISLMQKSQDVCLTKLFKNPLTPTAAEIANLTKLARVVSNDKNSIYVAFSTIVIVVGMLFNDPSIGLIVFIAGFFVIFLMLAAFAQAAMIYITSYFAILVLGLFAPIIIPCFLFKYTRRLIFEKWLQFLFVYTIQPGLVLCYLTFMLAVVQFISTYDSSMSSAPTVVFCTTANCSLDYQWKTCSQSVDKIDLGKGIKESCECGKAIGNQCLYRTATADAAKNFLDYVVGDEYKNGDKEDKPAFEMVDINSNPTARSNYSQNQLLALQKSHNIDYKSNSSLFYNTSIYYKMSSRTNSAVFMAPATETTVENKTNIFDIQSRGSRVNMPEIKLPSFSFFPKNFNGPNNDYINNVSKSLVNDFLSTDMPNGNIQNSLNRSSQDPAQVKKAITTQANFDKAQFQLKIGYMQYLLIMFIAMSICFTFMSNVVDFGAQLAGMSTVPMGRMINVYDLMSNKLARLLK